VTYVGSRESESHWGREKFGLTSTKIGLSKTKESKSSSRDISSENRLWQVMGTRSKGGDSPKVPREPGVAQEFNAGSSYFDSSAIQTTKKASLVLVLGVLMGFTSGGPLLSKSQRAKAIRRRGVGSDRKSIS